MNSQKMHSPIVGGSSLLVVFAVLCLTVFALLSLSTVQAEKRLSDTNANAVEQYYAADLEAEKILAQLRTGDVPECVTEKNGNFVYVCPMSEMQGLQVEVCIDGTEWEILRWQVVSTVEWNAEESISVWNGND